MITCWHHLTTPRFLSATFFECILRGDCAVHRGWLLRGFKETRRKLSWIKPRKLGRMKIGQSCATRIFTYLSSFYSSVVEKNNNRGRRTDARIKNVLCDTSKEKHSSIPLFFTMSRTLSTRVYISFPRSERYAKRQRAARKAITKRFDTLNLPLHSPLTQLPSALMPITIVPGLCTSTRFSYPPRKLQLCK